MGGAGGGEFSIGELARRTGLSVKALRYYADIGLLPPSSRTPAGYRRYDLAAVGRAGLVRSLRELGLPLAAVRAVLGRETTLAETAALHAEALDAQIRVLRLRRAVLCAVAERGSDPEEMEFMHRIARLTDEERHRVIEGFVDETFGGHDANPEFVGLLRASVPVLPQDPGPAQVAAWAELAELVADPGFREAVREMARYQAEERAAGDRTGVHHELTVEVVERVGAALAAGVRPGDAGAAPVLRTLLARYAEVFDRPDDAALPGWLLRRLEVADDPRTGRYWELAAVIEGSEPPPALGPVFAWLKAALRA